MTVPSSDARVSDAASYTLTVSGDPRFLATVRALSVRTAETVGVAPGGAARLGEVVGTVMETIAQAGASPADGVIPDVVQVRFEVGAEGLRVAITCDAPAGVRAGWTIERELAARGRLEGLRAAAPDAELGASGTRHFCRLTCGFSRRS